MNMNKQFIHYIIQCIVIIMWNSVILIVVCSYTICHFDQMIYLFLIKSHFILEILNSIQNTINNIE